MRYRILGPVELSSVDSPVRLGGPKQRAVLALLLLNANKVVPEHELVGAVWGDDPPVSVRGQLQMYVSRLRKLVGGAVIVRSAPGYLIRVRPGELDVEVFDDRVLAARREMAVGRVEEAVAGFRSALVLWRGPALGGVSEALAKRAEPVLSAKRLTVLEEYFDARLDAGQHGEVVREIRQVAEENPVRERFQAQLMLALHRSGRTVEALEVYSATRALLVTEKRGEPGPLLRETQARLLRNDDPEVLAPEPATTPRQLPADVTVFAGRTAELARLDALLPVDRVPVIAITGGAGLGKSALAVRWAHRVEERFPDGQLYANLGGSDASRNEAGDVVSGFLEALDLPATRIPVSTSARFSRYRDLLANRRILVVLDNARDAAQVRPLLPGAPGCLTVVTSRDQLPGLSAAPVRLGPLSGDEARDMLARRLGTARVEAEPDAVTRIVELCAGLPLALAIVAARAAAHQAFSLGALADELVSAGGLDAFDAGDPTADVRAVFSWSSLTLEP